MGLWLFERQDALPEIRDAGMDSPKEVMTDSITFITVIRWRRLMRIRSSVDVQEKILPRPRRSREKVTGWRIA
ncbi:hypothetical protein B4135_2698 [Caldibacillus debilis]|uniref:Uncharacterized protein n=1 Tax=Caldibacillus debilis TaxID=301148 RepID=A0A150LS92_9BACI|nr:hypothetical protein B4135_2698 [Caldibacillus debilis]